MAFPRESTPVRESAQTCCIAVMHQHQQVRNRITTSHNLSLHARALIASLCSADTAHTLPLFSIGYFSVCHCVSRLVVEHMKVSHTHVVHTVPSASSPPHLCSPVVVTPAHGSSHNLGCSPNRR